MPKPIPIPVRRKLLEATLAGATTAELATKFDLSPRTVRKLRKRFRERGPDAVQPDYHPPKNLLHAFPAKIREVALALRREHPTWGAVLIWVALGEKYPKSPRPHPRTLRLWLQKAGLGAPPKPKRPHARRSRTKTPHETWQIDACEKIPLADGSQISWLRVVDEATGAVLKTAIFPPGDLDTGRSQSHAAGFAPAFQPFWAAGTGALR
jgi:transposase